MNKLLASVLHEIWLVFKIIVNLSTFQQNYIFHNKSVHWHEQLKPCLHISDKQIFVCEIVIDQFQPMFWVLKGTVLFRSLF